MDLLYSLWLEVCITQIVGRILKTAQVVHFLQWCAAIIVFVTSPRSPDLNP